LSQFRQKHKDEFFKKTHASSILTSTSTTSLGTFNNIYSNKSIYLSIQFNNQTLIMPKTKEENYKVYLIKFMNFIHDTEYDVEHVFPNEVLGEIVPNDIVRFFKFKAFLIEDDRAICESTDRATGCRNSTLDMYKKSISFFMPNSIPTWDRLNNRGNPTKAVEVNNFLKLVTKFEVRKKGKPSCAKRALKK
jgi:hypothetical protein